MIDQVELKDSGLRTAVGRVGARSGSQRDALRARIVLLRAEEYKETAVAERLHVRPATVCKWSQRFELHRLEGLQDQLGRGRRSWLSEEQIAAVITRVIQPPVGRGRWSVRAPEAVAIDFWPFHGTRYDARIGIVEICRNDNQRLVVSKIGGALSVRMRLFT